MEFSSAKLEGFIFFSAVILEVHALVAEGQLPQAPEQEEDCFLSFLKAKRIRAITTAKTIRVGMFIDNLLSYFFILD